MTANYTMGIDVGSSFIKLALVDYQEQPVVIALANEKIRKRNPTKVIDKMLGIMLEEHNIDFDDLLYVASTGEGEMVTRKRGHFYSMTTHSRGAYFYHPEARSIADLGALFSRVVTLEEGCRVNSYAMTGQCASGSGQFLENITRYLGVTLDEVGKLSRQADEPAKTSGICAVLAETDVINMVSQGISTANIIKGIHQSIGNRILKLMRKLKVESPIILTGGMSLDDGLVAALQELQAEKEMGLEIISCKNAMSAGALGAALWGGFRHFKLLEQAA